MGNIHVGIRNGNDYQLTLHIAVPVGNNSGGVPWATALKNALAPASRLPSGDGTGGTISAAELAAVAAGTTLEIATSFQTSTTFEGLTAQQQLALLDAFYAQKTGEMLTQLGNQLKQYGMVLS